MNYHTPFTILIICTLMFEIEMVKIGISQSINSTLNGSEISITTTTTTAASTTVTSAATTTIVPTEQAEQDNFSTIIPTPQSLPTFPPKKSKSPPTTTTVATLSSTASIPISKEETKEVDANSQTKNEVLTVKRDNYNCFCNLKIDTCDINCCCDNECPAEALAVFNCLKEQQHLSTENTLDNTYYKHGLPLCGVNNGWLCVFRANLLLNPEDIYKNFDPKHRHKWPNNLESTIEQKTKSDASSLKYGDEIQIINILDYGIRNIYVSEGLPSCDFQTPILHLKSMTTSCLLSSIEEMQANKYKIQRIAMENNLLSKPHSEEIKNLDLISEDMKSLTMRSCVRANLNSVREKCKLIVYTNVTNDENNIAIAYLFTILHNYTNILGGNIDFKEIRVSGINANWRFEYWQTYTVQFIAVTDSVTNKDALNIDSLLEQPIRTASGPLGYLPGEPVIVSRYTLNNTIQESTTNNKLINYFHGNTTNSHMEHTLRLFTIHKKYCLKNLLSPSFINFGINTLKECNLFFNKTSQLYTKTENFTLVCNELQETIYAKLFEEDTTNLEKLTEILVSQYGKPSRESNKWLPLQVQNADYIPIFGEFNEQTQSFACHNVIISASYEFQYEIKDLYNVKHQALLKHAALIMGQRLDLEFALYEALIVPLTVSVMFYDASEIDHFAQLQGTQNSANSIAYSLYLECFSYYILLYHVFK